MNKAPVAVQAIGAVTGVNLNAQPASNTKVVLIPKSVLIVKII